MSITHLLFRWCVFHIDSRQTNVHVTESIQDGLCVCGGGGGEGGGGGAKIVTAHTRASRIAGKATSLLTMTQSLC